MILIRGGGDLGSGVALRLHRVGLQVVITELPEPLAVRRKVSFSEAVVSSEVEIEGVTGCQVTNLSDKLSILKMMAKDIIPVIIDPECNSVLDLHPLVLIDARMRKLPPEPLKRACSMFIGLGPGFIADENCHAVVETNRGHSLGKVIWEGEAQPDTGLPGKVGNHGRGRVLRAPVNGTLKTYAQICDQIEKNQIIAEVAGIPIKSTFKGVLRGLLPEGMYVTEGLKIGDLDPRGDPKNCKLISDKAMAIGGGVLEAILTQPHIRSQLWT
jgi:xanthine dehydrogenase accessory factor